MAHSTPLPKVIGRRGALCGLLLTIVSTLQGQTITGSLVGMEHLPSHIVLLEMRGMDHREIDSAVVHRKGRFSFRYKAYSPGFYQLQANDTDRVDLILDPREKTVKLSFTWLPLQEHVVVLASDENKALWTYKRISRESQLELAGLRTQRTRLSANDHAALAHLDSLEANVEARRKRSMDELLANRPDSYFAHVVRADRGLMAAIPVGPDAVRDAFGWADGRLLRSSLYPKALLAYLQSIPFDHPGGLHAGVDSLMAWTRPDTACWRYARLLLMRAFDQFGADDLAQHLVDGYVMGPKTLLEPEPELLAMVSERMRVAIGAKAPAVRLPDPTGPDTVALSGIWERHQHTVLFFYSSTCDHCHAQMPGLGSIHREMAQAGVAVVGIALDTDLDEFLEARAAHGIDWPTYSEQIGWGSPAAKAFGVKATPALIVLDRTGTIVARPADHELLRAFLEERAR